MISTLRRNKDFRSANHKMQYTNMPLGEYLIHNLMMTLTLSQRMLTNDIEVHHRVFDLAAFKVFCHSSQARIYCTHGTRYMLFNDSKSARIWYMKAIRCSPKSLRPYGLLVLSFLGQKSFSRISSLRRKNGRDQEIIGKRQS